MRIKHFLNKAINLLVPKKGNVNYGWSGNYSSWKEVSVLCNGYDDKIIFEKVKSASLAVKNGKALFERDSVLFFEEDRNEDFLKIIDAVALDNNNELHVLDFGGSLGSLYFQYKSEFSKYKNLKWSIIEQSHFVDFGKKELQDENLRFYYTIEECIKDKNKADIVILSSVISYFEKPYELLSEIISFNFKYILIDKTIFCNFPEDILTLQIVPPEIYTASYPCWVLNEHKLCKFVSTKYDLQKKFNPFGETVIKIDDKTAYFKALLFKIK